MFPFPVDMVPPQVVSYPSVPSSVAAADCQVNCPSVDTKTVALSVPAWRSAEISAFTINSDLGAVVAKLEIKITVAQNCRA